MHYSRDKFLSSTEKKNNNQMLWGGGGGGIISVRQIIVFICVLNLFHSKLLGSLDTKQ